MYRIIPFVFLGLSVACSNRKSTTDDGQANSKDTVAQRSTMNTYDHDRQFLRQHHPDLVELQAGDARVLVCPAYQGRIMTSSADGHASYGWINYGLIHSG